MLLGRTGDGKSSVSNLIVKTLNCNSEFPKFVEGATATAVTGNSSSASCGNFEIIDTPGMLDPKGITQDEENIKDIVLFGKEKGYINAVLFVMNGQAPRFDDGIQRLTKLFVDSFGIGILNHVGIIYSKTYGIPDDQTKANFLNNTETVIELMNDRCKSNLTHIPSWHVDCHPEELKKLDLPPKKIKELQGHTKSQVESMLLWSSVQKEYSTEFAIFGKYEETMKKMEAERLLKEAQYNASVVSRTSENKIDVTSTTSTPIIRDIKERYWEPFIKFLGWYTRESRYVSKHVGNTEKRIMREMSRVVNIHGSGEKSYEEWKVLREWEESSEKMF